MSMEIMSCRSELMTLHSMVQELVSAGIATAERGRIGYEYYIDGYNVMRKWDTRTDVSLRVSGRELIIQTYKQYKG